jgi:hypothetical protein
MQEYLNQIPDFLLSLWIVFVFIGLFRTRKLSRVLDEVREDILARAINLSLDEIDEILNRLQSLNNLKMRIKVLFFFWNPVTFYIDRNWILNGDKNETII